MTDWQKQALDDLKNTTMSRAEIARKYNRSPATIQRLIKLNNVQRPKGTQKGQRSLNETKPLSPQHHWIGIRLQILDTDNQLRERLGVSRYAFAAMKLGAHDYSLSQLQRIADILQVDLSEFVKPLPQLRACS